MCIERKNKIERFLLERGFKKEIDFYGDMKFFDNYEEDIVIIGKNRISFYVRFNKYEENFGFKLDTKKFEKYFKAFCNKIIKYQKIINRYEKFQEKIKNIKEKYSILFDKIIWNPKNNRFEVKIKLLSFITEKVIFKEQEFILTDNGKILFLQNFNCEFPNSTLISFDNNILKIIQNEIIKRKKLLEDIKKIIKNSNK